MSIYTVGDYLLGRLQELGVRHLFGVPGDYVLGFNAQIEATPALASRWVAKLNELNAAYAAEGYARVHGVGAFVVTGGVGDLGAAGGVCGALAERSSVVAISPVPAPPGQGRRTTPRATAISAGLEGIYREITVAHTTLTADNAAAEIDRVLATCVAEHGPVFIALPADVAPAEIAPRQAACRCGQYRTRTSSASSPRPSPGAWPPPPGLLSSSTPAYARPGWGKRWPPPWQRAPSRGRSPRPRRPT